VLERAGSLDPALAGTHAQGASSADPSIVGGAARRIAGAGDSCSNDDRLERAVWGQRIS